MTYDTIEEKIHALAECGFELKEPFDVSDLVKSWGQESLNELGFDMALVCLGMTEEEPPWSPHCDNLWHFDTECIEGDGSYVCIAERMAKMAGGSLPLSDIEDHVDYDGGKAWLRFKCQGEQIHVNCAVQDDWVDTSIFAQFVGLLARRDPTKLYVYFDLGGQDCLIGCVTRDQFEKLKRLIPKAEPLT